MAEDIRQDTPDELNDEHEACRENAWKALCEGIYTYRGIARYVNERSGCSHTHEWVKRNLAKQAAFVEELVDDGAIAARAEYIQGLRLDLAAQAAIANDPAAERRERIAARKAVTEIREKLAMARGVVTVMQRTEVTGAGGGALEHRVVFEVVRPESNDDGDGPADD